MPIRLGAPELILVLIIVIIIFGVGRVGKIGGELGAAIRQFREGLGAGKSDEEKKPETPDENKS
jgi:sec-independent protein translocase protein TatA